MEPNYTIIKETPLDRAPGWKVSTAKFNDEDLYSTSAYFGVDGSLSGLDQMRYWPVRKAQRILTGRESLAPPLDSFYAKTKEDALKQHDLNIERLNILLNYA
jgi:hypothetical protein